MKLLICVFIVASSLCAMEKKYTALSAAEKISLLNAITDGSLKSHDRYLEFPAFFKNQHKEIIYFQSYKDILGYLKKVTHHCKWPDKEDWFMRAEVFANENPGFLQTGGTEENNKKFKSIMSQIFAYDVWGLSGRREKNWKNFLIALNNRDKKYINDLMQKVADRDKRFAALDREFPALASLDQ